MRAPTRPLTARACARPPGARLRSLAALLVLAAGPGIARGSTPPPDAGAPPRLDSADAVAAAVLSNNPELAAVEARIAALEHAVPQAGVWPDPVAAIEDSNVPLDDPWPGSHPMAGLQLRLQQTVPFPGKTRARTATARSRVETGRATLAEARVRLEGLVRGLYLQLALVRQLRRVTERHVALVDELTAAVRARYETGAAPQHDLMRLQVLRDRLADDVADLDRRDRELTASLLATVHVPPDVPVDTPEVTPLPPPAPPLATLVETADVSRPALHVLESAARTAALAARVAEIERRPDVTLWLGYRYREPVGADRGEDLYTAAVSVPLPWFWNERRWGERAGEERARSRAFLLERSARLDEIRGALDATVARWRRAEEKARVYETELAPAQRRTVDSVLASYRVGRAGFETLYRAELELLELERTIHTARADAARAAVDVAALVGAYAGERPAEGG